MERGRSFAAIRRGVPGLQPYDGAGGTITGPHGATIGGYLRRFACGSGPGVGQFHHNAWRLCVRFRPARRRWDWIRLCLGHAAGSQVVSSRANRDGCGHRRIGLRPLACVRSSSSQMDDLHLRTAKHGVHPGNSLLPNCCAVLAILGYATAWLRGGRGQKVGRLRYRQSKERRLQSAGDDGDGPVLSVVVHVRLRRRRGTDDHQQTRQDWRGTGPTSSRALCSWRPWP